MPFMQSGQRLVLCVVSLTFASLLHFVWNQRLLYPLKKPLLRERLAGFEGVTKASLVHRQSSLHQTDNRGTVSSRNRDIRDSHRQRQFAQYRHTYRIPAAHLGNCMAGHLHTLGNTRRKSRRRSFHFLKRLDPVQCVWCGHWGCSGFHN